MNLSNGMFHSPPFPNNFANEFLALERGKGVYIYDTDHRKYLDFGAGIAVNALGYGCKDLAETAKRQMMKLIHVSNLYATVPSVTLAEKLTALGDFSAVHFGNSGTEANEAALKYSRIYSMRTKGEGHHKFLSFEHAFHGRTMGSMSVTPAKAYKEAAEPLVPGCVTIPYNDVETLEKTLDASFAAVIVEPLQGEGGLHVMTQEFAKALNSICEKHDVIIIADEVQTGLGRLGEIFGSHFVGLKPDIITLSKPLAGGLPLSATLIPEKINRLVKLGEHGTTFGGGPVTTAVALKVLEKLTATPFLQKVRERAAYLEDRLEELAAAYSAIDGRHGAGLLQGISISGESNLSASDVITKCRENGLLVLKSGKNRIRLAPPLIITEKEIEYGVAILEKIIKSSNA